jgi:hypothetical protein
MSKTAQVYALADAGTNPAVVTKRIIYEHLFGVKHFFLILFNAANAHSSSARGLCQSGRGPHVLPKPGPSRA